MTETMELRDDPVMYPTIVRRVHEGRLELMERKIGGRGAMCVFWSASHAETVMHETGFVSEEGWKPVEQDIETLGLIFCTLPEVELTFIEKAPDDPALGGLPMEKAALLDMLEECRPDEDDE